MKKQIVLASFVLFVVGCGAPVFPLQPDAAMMQPADASAPAQDSGMQMQPPADAAVPPADTPPPPPPPPPPACGQGLTPCASGCVDTQANGANCGACGRSCAVGQSCIAGSCRLVCPPGQTACGNACVNMQTDAANCGTCGNACASGSACMAGACAPTCSAPRLRCGASCVDAQTDAANCGGCNVRCAAGQSCVSGVCALVCASGLTTCGAACVNTRTDTMNCGGCNVRCVTGQSCVAGSCQTVCPSGTTACGTGCVNTWSDASNCGTCGNRCASGVCSSGVCTTPAPTCSPSTCPARTNANPVCTGGVCGFTCYLSYGNCDGNAGNGCETALTTNSNCGSCGNACATGLRCEDGACVATPPPPSRYLVAQFATAAFVCTWDLNADNPPRPRACSPVAGGIMRVSITGPYWPGNHIRVGVALDDPMTTSGDRVRWIANDIGLEGRTARQVGFSMLQIEQSSGIVSEYLLDMAQSCVDVCHPSFPRWRETKVTVRTRSTASVCPVTCDAP